MYVCLCRGVTDRAIREAVLDGNDTVEKAAVATGAGAGCGCCLQEIADLVDEELSAARSQLEPLARLRCRKKGMSVTFLASQPGEASGT